MCDFEYITKGENLYRKHKEICKERWNENNKIILSNEKIIVNYEINWNYIKNYQLGFFLDFPLIKNAESRNRLLEFASNCLSKQAPLSQGYYFDETLNVSRFIRGVITKYLLENINNFSNTWYHINSEKIVDKIISNEIKYYSFTDHEILFIVNSYNRYYQSKKHKALYRIINDIMAERERFNKRTFILSLTQNVGPDKGQEHGFSIPMFPIKEKIKEVLETKATGINPWINDNYKVKKIKCFFGLKTGLLVPE